MSISIALDKRNQRHIPIYELLSCKLEIPDYQRPYSWETEQVEELLDDLYEAFEANLFSHYLVGNIILHKESKNNKIVDGQQRLITFALIFYYFDRNNPSKILGEIISALSTNALQKNFETIKNKLRSLFSQDEFYKFLKEQVFVTFSITDKIEEAFFYFDSQNTRGKELERKDLLKVHHFRLLDEDVDSIKKEKIVRKWEMVESLDSKRDDVNENKIDLEKLLRDHLAVARLGIRHELEPSSIVYIDVFKEFKSDGKVGKLNNYNQPPMFESFVYDIENDWLQFRPKLASYNGPYGFNDGLSFLPFEIVQSIEGGENFFYYVFKYDKLYETMCEYDCFTILDNLSGAGNKYLRKIYKSSLMLYFDKFGEERFEEFAYMFFFLIYYYRLWQGTINRYGIVKFEWNGSSSLDPFKLIFLKYSPDHVLKNIRSYIQFKMNKMKITIGKKIGIEEFIVKKGEKITEITGVKKTFIDNIDNKKANKYIQNLRNDWSWEVINA